MDGLKLFWGVIFAGIFLKLAISFAKRANKSEDIKYNGFGVVLVFLIIGFVLFLTFFAQI